MKKIKIFFDPRKEEDWLNSIKGYKLVKVGLISYEFVESDIDYSYAVNYTPSKMEYLKLMNNLKNYSQEIKYHMGWTYIMKEKRYKTFYRKEKDYHENLKLFVTKYSLYSRSFLMFGLASLALAFSVSIYFIICSILLFLLSLLYYICIRSTKKILSK